jgi:tagaturonate reductase
VLAAHQAGLDTVEECIKDQMVYSFMRKGIFEEIIPSMDGDQGRAGKICGGLLERFANPYIRHLLMSISSTPPASSRPGICLPCSAIWTRKARLPKRLVFSLAALISFYQGTEKDGAAQKGDRNGQTYLIQDSPEVLARFAQLVRRRGRCFRQSGSAGEGHSVGKLMVGSGSDQGSGA